MKLKYYMRGIGIGMIVTALVLMLGASIRQPMTDNEIIERAKELGLVENMVVKDFASEDEQEQNSDNVIEEPSEEITEEPSGEITEEPSEEITEEPSGEITEEPSEEITDESSDPITDEVIEEFVIVHIISGDSSVSVSQKVYELGLVEDASEFDAFLCANGYDRILSVGQHEVRKGASMKEIADSLVRK